MKMSDRNLPSVRQIFLFLVIGGSAIYIVFLGIILITNFVSTDNPRRTEYSSVARLDSSPTTVVLFSTTKQFTPTRELFSQPSNTPRNQSPTDCTLWSDVSVEDVGKSMCVFGKVEFIASDGQAFFIYFVKDTRVVEGDFYLLSYRREYRESGFGSEMIGNCIQISGDIERIGSSPVIVFTDYENEIDYCYIQ